MKGEGQEVHGGQHHGEVVFAVAEIVFERTNASHVRQEAGVFQPVRDRSE
jgi:hypothetical protein